MADDKNNNEGRATKAMRPEDTIWVICASPVTLLMPAAPPAPAAEDKADRRSQVAHVPLKLERGLNVLAGPVMTAGGSVRWLTLDGLPSTLQQLQIEERAQAARDLFGAARKLYAAYFERTGGVPPRISAVGPMSRLVSDHFAELLDGARLGTHRASLEGFVHFPGTTVPEHVKALARVRLTAWRPAD